MISSSATLMLLRNGPGMRSIDDAMRRNPKTTALGHPIGNRSATAIRHATIPTNATKMPQPSIEWGNDHAVSSRPNVVCQIASKTPAIAVTTKPPPAIAIAPGIAKGNGRRRNVRPNCARRSGVNVIHMSVSVARKCIEYRNRCGGEKKSSNGWVACQRRSHPNPTPNARISKSAASQRRR
jgi:hypothetical protein